MPDRSALYNQYFKAEDFRESGPRTFTIKAEVEENTAKEGEPPVPKSVLYFEEDKRGLVLNTTRYSAAAEIFGTKNTDKWIGNKITIYTDPDIKFGTKKVGGLAVAPPK